MKNKLLFLFAVATILVGCGGKSMSPEEATLGFVKAFGAKDFEGAKAFCTKGSAPVIDGIKGLGAMAPAAKISKEEVKCEVVGDKAKCKFCCIEGKDIETYNLIKEDGNWKVEFVKNATDNSEVTEPVVEETPEEPAVEGSMDCDEFLTKYSAFLDEYAEVMKAVMKDPKNAENITKSSELGVKAAEFSAPPNCTADAAFATKYAELAVKASKIAMDVTKIKY